MSGAVLLGRDKLALARFRLQWPCARALRTAAVVGRGADRGFVVLRKAHADTGPARCIFENRVTQGDFRARPRPYPFVCR